jgi:putative ABC transport system permease protein
MFDFPNLGLSLPDVADLRSSSSTLEQVVPISYSASELTGYGTPERLETAAVPAEFFATLGVHTLYGREFLPDDVRPGSRAVILSYSLWRDHFAADPAAIGKTVMLDSQPHTIVGVMPYFAPIDFATDSQILTPLLPGQEDLTHRGNHMFPVLASLKPGATLAQTQRELDTISARLASAYPGEDKGWSIHATPLKEYLLGDAATPLTILFCAVGFVLLIACANVSNLFLSRGWARRREFAVRIAIGATRGDLFRQLSVECTLIALAGGACALLLANFALHGLRLALPPGIPRLEALRIDIGVILFAFAASLLAAFLSGLAPAWMSSRLDPHLAIKESGEALRAGSRHNLLRRFLVVGEVGVAFVLLVGATLAIQSFARILRANLGFRPDHLVTMRLDFPHHRFARPEQAFGFARQVLASSRAVPGVTAVSAGMVYPLSDEVAETTFYTEQSFASSSQPLSALGNRVAPDYFRTLGIPLLAGRDFTDSDRQNSTTVFIVNETLARKFFGSLDIIGKRLATRVQSGKPLWGEIVGVVGNVRAQDPSAESKPAVYGPLNEDENPAGLYLLARSTPDPLSVVPAIQERVRSIDKNQPITHVQTLTAQIDHIHATPRSQSLLLGIFSVLGFVLALIGVYGVMSYLVGQQTREIGIRMALGAKPAGILRQVIAHGFKLTVSGVFIGVAAAIGLTRFLRSLLFEISATDPLTFAVVAALLTIVAMAACYLPARRAMGVDPIQALRHE